MISTQQAQQIADDFFGVSGTAKPLPGYDNQNFLIRAGNRAVVLKLSGPAETPHRLRLQNAVLQHLASKPLTHQIPHLKPCCHSASVDRFTPRVPISDTTCYARLMTFVSGSLWQDAVTANACQLEELGSTAGRLDAALLDLDFAGPLEGHVWDLQSFGEFRPWIDAIANPTDRALVDQVWHQFQSAEPTFAQLRRSVIHGDISQSNVTVDRQAGDSTPRILSVFDFGDALQTCTIFELAIAIAYGCLDQPDPMAAAMRILIGYDHALPVLPCERQVLYPLILARLAASVIMSAKNRQDRPGNPHHVFAEQTSWLSLRTWAQIRHDDATAAFLAAR